VGEIVQLSGRKSIQSQGCVQTGAISNARLLLEELEIAVCPVVHGFHNFINIETSPEGRLLCVHWRRKSRS
jgi:hypothetical protein